MLGPGGRSHLPGPGPVLRDVEIAVAVDVTEPDPFAVVGAHRHPGPDIGRALPPEVGTVPALAATDDVEIAVGLEVADLDVVVVGARGTDQMLGPGVGARIADRPWVLVPLETARVGDHDVQIAIAVDVPGLHIGGPRAGGTDRPLGP